MHFSVIREHREFFRNHQWIECDGVLSGAEQRRLSEGISGVLEERSGVKPSILIKKSHLQDFDLGHDVWRGAPSLKKIILGSSLAEIAGELIEHKPLRFGYDTFFPDVSKSADDKNAYAAFLQTTPTLAEMSCIQGVVCGAMLCISGREAASSDEKMTTLFSRVPGNAVYFSPDWALPLHEIYQNPSFTYLLVAYVKTNAVYCMQHGDPHLHDFKRLGYNFGDRLKEPFHPIVYS